MCSCMYKLVNVLMRLTIIIVAIYRLPQTFLVSIYNIVMSTGYDIIIVISADM